MKINEKFLPLFNPPNGVRYFILTGGRFSQKSFAVGTAAASLAYNLQHRILYTRYTLSSAKDSIIPEVTEKMDMLNISNSADVSSDRIQFNHKGKIVFKGIRTSSGNQTAKLKGLKDFSCFILDEAEEENDEASFDKISLSIRAADVSNIIILILNPTTKQHWIYKRFFEDAGVEAGSNCIKDNVCYIHTTFKDAIDFVPVDYLEELKILEQRNISKYNHIILGGWLDAAEGVIFDNWSYGSFDEYIPFGYGMDFGFFPDPDVLVKVAIDNKRKIIYCKEVIQLNNAGLDKLANEILTNADISKLIIADCAEPRLINDLRNKGIRITPVKKGAGSILAGIKLMQDYKIVVDNNSTRIGSELNNYAWSDKKSGTPIDAYNHWVDAIRYYVSSNVNKVAKLGTRVSRQS